MKHQSDSVGRRAALEIVALRHLKAVPGHGEREDQPAQRRPVAVTGITPAVRPPAQFPAQSLKRVLLGRRQRSRTVIANCLR
jgi:hypothetical protein